MPNLFQDNDSTILENVEKHILPVSLLLIHLNQYQVILSMKAIK